MTVLHIPIAILTFKTDIDSFILVQAKISYLVIAEHIFHFINIDEESGLFKTFIIITAVFPDMVFKAEKPEPFCRVCDGKVFKRLLLKDRHLEHCKAIGLQDPAELSHGLVVIRDMLQNMVTYDKVKGLIRKGDIGNVDFMHDILFVKISSDIFKRIIFLEKPA